MGAGPFVAVSGAGPLGAPFDDDGPFATVPGDDTFASPGDVGDADHGLQRQLRIQTGSTVGRATV